jgi:hypothetical protein
MLESPVEVTAPHVVEGSSSVERHAALRGIAIVIVTVAICVAAPSTAVAASGRPVSPAVYVKTVCNAIATYDAEVVGASAPYQRAASAFTAAPTGETATQVREAFVDLLDVIRKTSRDVVVTARSVVPSGKAGARFAKALLTHLQATVTDAGSIAAQAKAKALDVTSVDRFSSRYRALLAKLDGISEAERERARKDPALANASAPFGPIVVYMTTTAPRCPSLSEPSPGTGSLA